MFRFIIFYIFLFLGGVACRSEIERSPGNILWRYSIDDDENYSGETIVVSEDSRMITAISGKKSWVLETNGEFLSTIATHQYSWINGDQILNTYSSAFSTDSGEEIEHYEYSDSPFGRKGDVSSLGNILIAGYYGQVWKFSPSREILWNKDFWDEWGDQFGTIRDDEFDAFFDADDNLIILGINDTNGESCGGSIFIGKYSDKGEELWTFCYDGEDQEYATRIADADSQNSIVQLTGSTLQTNAAEHKQWRLRKYDASGNEIWTKVISDTVAGPSNIYDLVIDNNDNIILTGEVLGREPELSQDVWVAKYDTDANSLWTTTVEGLYNENERGEAVEVDEQGNIYVLATTHVPDPGQVTGVPKGLEIFKIAP